MILTLEFTPAEEARLAAAASQNGLEPAALAKKLVTEHLPSVQNGTAAAVQEQERIARIRVARGSMGHVPGATVEDLHRERQADKAKEEAWAKHPALKVPGFFRLPSLCLSLKMVCKPH